MNIRSRTHRSSVRRERRGPGKRHAAPADHPAGSHGTPGRARVAAVLNCCRHR